MNEATTNLSAVADVEVTAPDPEADPATAGRQDRLRYSVILHERMEFECPLPGDAWEAFSDDDPSWGAVLSPCEFAGMCKDLSLYASCTTQGSVGAPAFENVHWVPAYCFCDCDEDYKAWVTPWTPRIRTAALAEVGNAEPENFPVFGQSTPLTALWVPLWGDGWPKLETALKAAFSEEKVGNWQGPVEALITFDPAADEKAEEIYG